MPFESQYTRRGDASEQLLTEIENVEPDPQDTPSDIRIASDATVGKDSKPAQGGRRVFEQAESIARRGPQSGIRRAAIGTVRAPDGCFLPPYSHSK